MDEPTLVGGSVRSGLNHYLTKNPTTSICGQRKPNGWAPPHDGGKLCAVCESRGNYNSVTNRPMPDKTKGIKR